MLPSASAAGDLSPPTKPRAVGSRRRTRLFYVAMTLVLCAMVVRGFWPSYFGHLFSGTVDRPRIMHLHGAYFTGWMLLLLAQVGLIYAGRLRTHRAVGIRVGIAYGIGLLVLGLVVSIVAPVLHVRAGEWTMDRAAGFLILPLGDMVLFAGFFGAAVALRNRPEPHKRLMLVATITVAFAAVARMGFESLLVSYLVWMAPLFAGMAFDAATRRRVHPAYLVSLAVLSVAFLRVLLMESEGWLRVGRALLVPFV